uniref:ABC transmembrane type-1 domain-containing protein n=1 Tax=Heterorhabditis bacteriophora TaxID=37862 RepID=A0A1I7WT98_HETBA
MWIFFHLRRLCITSHCFIHLKDIVKAAQMANAHGFIMQTTSKYDTNVGEKGSQMSGEMKFIENIQQITINQNIDIQGRVDQMGTHEELLRQPGTYATLVQRQMMGDQRVRGGFSALPPPPPPATSRWNISSGENVKFKE